MNTTTDSTCKTAPSETSSYSRSNKAYFKRKLANLRVYGVKDESLQKHETDKKKMK